MHNGLQPPVAPNLLERRFEADARTAFGLGTLRTSLAASGDRVPSLLGPVVFLVLALASWALRPARRTLAVVHIAGPRSTERAELQTA